LKAIESLNRPTSLDFSSYNRCETKLKNKD